MALACRPALLIADEPTSSLDVATQAQVLELVKELRKTKTSVLMITHNFGVVAEVCDRVAVMYSGNIVECATVLDIFKDPKHPYTVGLLNAVPKFGKVSSRDRLQTIPGSLPNLANPPKGCRFHPRCSYSMDVCKIEKPQYCEIGQDHFVACHKFS
jgi:peptide/nickel transport system ATP-binding protein